MAAGINDITIEGAGFVLYRSVTNTSGVTTKYYYSYKEPEEEEEAGTTGWVKLSAEVTLEAVTLTTGKDGKILLHNVPDDIYYLEEVIAPNGYRLLTGPLAVTVEGSKITGVEGLTCAAVSGDGLTLAVPSDVNYELPETGGEGTFLYAMGGTLLMAGCLLCGYLLRRIRERRSAR